MLEHRFRSSNIFELWGVGFFFVSEVVSVRVRVRMLALELRLRLGRGCG